MTPQMLTAPKADPLLDAMRPRLTGSWLVSLEEDASIGSGVDALRQYTGTDVSVAVMSELQMVPPAPDGGIILFEDIKLAVVVPRKRQQIAAAMAELGQRDEIAEARPEFYLFGLQEFRDTAEATWGIGATHALQSAFTGKGIKIAILDTGIDLAHPDFVGRPIVTRSFVAGETIDDVQGHGTHCAGTAAGKSRMAGTPRYGVAPDAELYIGKVLNNSGFAAESDIIAGISWAINQQCAVISLSLGSPVRQGESYSRIYERIGRIALDSGSLVCAAAGNDSNRTFGAIAPVSSPANAPSIVAVGAVDALYQPASFSNGGINPDGGEIDLVAPGVGIFSSSPSPRLYRIMDGSSMACPHVAGVAALWAESDASMRGRALLEALRNNARPLPHNRRDVGVGLVTAPSNPVS
ncbi:S8 family serine peptidase [Rhizobium sp. 18055]|uniref:S8 family serine peptidase n=1 Tax=Rhizobium sp. 18055 TaxID=2681403 RepID=UPI001FCE8B50|nr:S8 family serine peptidase [Rhizobium sp. 18055]